MDTYDTLGGVRAAIEVIRELGLRERLGIRIDSGDLPSWRSPPASCLRQRVRAQLPRRNQPARP